jgi:hypothetical protein
LQAAPEPLELNRVDPGADVLSRICASLRRARARETAAAPKGCAQETVYYQ